ncbi:uncharacterized protein BO97DRAFT_24166 [Aspergillus homomorphus CBS 101889]|uniref:Uncharacterized protein n=1 Tax=Aspergillus homomorphus (strain CBS 101889) TaxID=1450537 RepID=A0A395HGH5_ASPHC|nr:hypothetical protein BO97DRAFT_24166 [Aspergillus homomorphus CBS 101889]RAL06573.1 hypothetical protein BO97DRAFT_24166 [Aspergillus homomorphus CBS 101889]
MACQASVGLSLSWLWAFSFLLGNFLTIRDFIYPPLLSHLALCSGYTIFHLFFSSLPASLECSFVPIYIRVEVQNF